MNASKLQDALGRELAVGDVVIAVHVSGSRAEYGCGMVESFTKSQVKVARYNDFQRRVDVTSRQPDKLIIMREETFSMTEWRMQLINVREDLIYRGVLPA